MRERELGGMETRWDRVVVVVVDGAASGGGEVGREEGGVWWWRGESGGEGRDGRARDEIDEQLAVGIAHRLFFALSGKAIVGSRYV